MSRGRGGAGDLNERLQRGQVRVSLRRGRRTLARLTAPARQLLPRSRGHVVVRVPRTLGGPVVATVTVRPTAPRLAGPGAPAAPVVTRTFRITFVRPGPSA